MIEIEMPDGTIVEFPEGTSREVMQNALAQYKTQRGMGFPDTPQGGSATNSAAVAELGSSIGSAFDGAVEGAKFNLGDNLSGVRSALMGVQAQPDGTSTFGDYSGTMGSRYAEGRDAERARLGRSRDANPASFGAGNIGGMVGTSLAALPAATGRGLLGTVLRGMGIGGVEGAIAGAGSADGVETGKSAAMGGLLGTILGGAAPVGVAAGSRVARGVSDPISGLFDMALNRANTGKANRAIASTFEGSGRQPSQVADDLARALSDGQPEFRLMDALGMSGQRTANGIVRGGDSDAAREIAEFLEMRQRGQPERVGGFVDDAFGMQGRTAAQAEDSMRAERSTAADRDYGAARGNAAPVDVRGAVSAIDDRIGGMQGSGVTGDGIDAKLAGYRRRLVAERSPDGEISRELSDFDRVLGVKQSVQDDIGAAVRAGRNNEARELGKLMNELDGALEQSSDMYRAANDGFRTRSQEIGAINEGAGMMRGERRAADTTQQFGAMTPDQQQAARLGYGGKMQAQIEANKAPTANSAKTVRSPKMDAEARAMALDPEQYARRLGREGTMWETQNTALRGSKTADNLQDIERANSASGGLLAAAQKGANFQMGDAVAQIMATLGPAARGQTEATRQLIARALLSTDPMAALAPALRQDASGQIQRRVIESIVRNTARPALN